MRHVLFPIALLFALGCAASGPPRYRVTGTVTLDGAAVPDGVIQFVAPDGRADGEQANIRDGRYEARLPAGPRQVRITSDRAVPGKKDKLGMELREQVVPKQYNTATTLTVTVAGDQTENFTLASK